MIRPKCIVVAVILTVTFFLPSSSDAHPRENQYVNGVNRMPSRATSYSYLNESDALSFDRRLQCDFLHSRLMYNSICWRCKWIVTCLHYDAEDVFDTSEFERARM